jgi:dephospho-CoA kinase
MLVVALTGGIGSGKSLAAQYFSDLGARVIDADQLARSAIERGTSGFDEVVAAFGDAILKDGDIDRRALAQIIFGSADARTRLEMIIHPRVRDQFEEAISLLHGDDVLIYEIPLLFETGASPRFDYVITVESSNENRRSRLMERGLRASEIESRIAAQASPEDRASIANYVLRNDGSRDHLLREVEHIWEEVLPSLHGPIA